MLDHCLWQLDRMTVQPSATYLVNHAGRDGVIDLVPRIQAGVASARRDGIDICFIVENDDFFPEDYFKRLLPWFHDRDFVGQNFTHYYSLKEMTYQRFDHPNRSSLCATAFRVSALNNFDWPQDDYPFLDIPLWKYARHKRRKFIDTGMVGIKTGLGLCGGKGHRMKLRNHDYDLKWLAAHVDAKSLEFYQQLSLSLRA